MQEKNCQENCLTASSRRESVINTIIGVNMLWTIAVVLLILWALGLVSSYTIGGYIHFLLVIAVIVVLIRVIQGRRVL